MKTKIVRYFEYDIVKFNAAQNYADGSSFTFSDNQVSALRKYHTISGGLYYDLIDNGIRFKEYVGVIQINELTIEVLPKVDKEDRELGKWQAILLNMLRECRFIEPESKSYANLKLTSNSVLRLYFEKFVFELETLLHLGLIKKYRTEAGNQTSLKGRLCFGKHIQQNLLHAERFYTSYTVYDKTHYIHQILLQALTVIGTLIEQDDLKERINTLLCQWPQGQLIKINERLFATITVNRKTQPYQKALLIAKMILLNYHPDLRGGKQSVLALMFNMNELWEEFIYRRLKLVEKDLHWKVVAQKGVNYWIGDSGSKRLIPDIIINQLGNGKRIILDTKWKRPFNNKPDDHDLRQLLSYKLYYQGDTAYLLYPCCGIESHVIKGSYSNKTHHNQLPVFKENLGLHGGLMCLNMVNDKKLISKSDFKNLIEEKLKPVAVNG